MQGRRNRWVVAAVVGVVALASACTAWAAGAKAVSLNDIVCPSASACFGVQTGTGKLVVVHTPAAKAPSAHAYGAPKFHGETGADFVGGIDCPTAAFCAGIAGYSTGDASTSDALTSTDPAAGTWKDPEIGGSGDSIAQISCPSAHLCVATEDDTAILWSTDPSGNYRHWHTTKLSGGSPLGIDCPTTTFCAAVDSSGAIWTSTQPTGGTSAWTQSGAKPLTAAAGAAESNFTNNNALVPELLSCSGPTLCVGLSGAGTAVVSTDPGSSAAWTPVALSAHALTAVACVAGQAFCAAGDHSGDVYSSANPAGGTTAWQTAAGTPKHGIASLSCTAGRCAAADGGAPLLATVGASGSTAPLSFKALSVKLG